MKKIAALLFMAFNFSSIVPSSQISKPTIAPNYPSQNHTDALTSPAINPTDFKGLTPQEIMDSVKKKNPKVTFTRVYNRDEWIAGNLSELGYFSIDTTGDFLVIKLRNAHSWTGEQAIAWLGTVGIHLKNDLQKVGPKNWRAKVTADYLDSIFLAFNNDTDQPQGSLFVLGLAYKKSGNEWDKIVFRDGRVIECEVVESGQMSIKYKLPDESVLMGASKNQIKHILYRSGRLEQGAQLPVINGPDDWHKVILTTNPADVEGLKRIREIKGRSGWGGSMGGNLGNAGAKRSLQKAAAKLRAPIVLLQGRTKGMSTVVTGIAYK